MSKSFSEKCLFTLLVIYVSSEVPVVIISKRVLLHLVSADQVKPLKTGVPISITSSWFSYQRLLLNKVSPDTRRMDFFLCVVFLGLIKRPVLTFSTCMGFCSLHPYLQAF